MVERLRNPRLLAAGAVLAAFALVAVFGPHPGPTAIRDWAHSAGPMFPLLFFVVHSLVTIAPIPRSAFTVAAGLLFGPVSGVLIAVSASTLSALLALLLVRAIGREAVAAKLTHPKVAAVDRRLARRGWVTVGSLRLIAAAPFSLVNYCCGVSSIRVLPYTAATLVGVAPGTVAMVVFGDALTGHLDPLFLPLSIGLLVLGVAGLFLDHFLDRRDPAPFPGADVDSVRLTSDRT